LRFQAVAFDLDGTLYPDIQLFSRLIPFILKEFRLLKAMDKARKQLRNQGGYGPDFYDTQAGLMARILGEPAETVRERTELLIYRGWEPFFKKIRLFPHVMETLDNLKKIGIKMGLLSDFPPEVKLKNLGIDKYWDVIVCSEESGSLKPDIKPFRELAGKMSFPPEEILYVGNSFLYDVKGAYSAGMKTALRQRRWKKRPSQPVPDFVFNDYRQLLKYVLG